MKYQRAFIAISLVLALWSSCVGLLLLTGIGAFLLPIGPGWIAAIIAVPPTGREPTPAEDFRFVMVWLGTTVMIYAPVVYNILAECEESRNVRDVEL